MRFPISAASHVPTQGLAAAFARLPLIRDQAASGLRAAPTSPQRGPDIGRPSSAPTVHQPTDQATISDAGKHLLDQPDAQERQVRTVLKDLFGITDIAALDLKIDVSHAHASASSTSQQQQSSASGSAFDYHESYREADVTTLAAAGTITLGDGRSFALQLQYERSEVLVREQTISQRSGSFVADQGAPAESDDASHPGMMFDDLIAEGRKFLDQLKQFYALRPFEAESPAATPSWTASYAATTMSTHAVSLAFNSNPLEQAARDQALSHFRQGETAADRAPQVDVLG